MARANGIAVSCPEVAPFPFNSRFIRVSQAAKFLGVSETQIRLLCDNDFIKTIRTFNGHRRIDAHALYQYSTGMTFQEANESPAQAKSGRLIGLCRVSGRKQATSNGDNKSSLEHQADHVRDYCIKQHGREPDEMLLHQRSGLNFSHPLFVAFIQRIVSGELRGATLVLTHPDRLARGARCLIELLLTTFGVSVEYVFKTDDNIDPIAEMSSDFLDIATIYTSRNSARKSALVTRIDLQPDHLEVALKQRKKGMTYQQIADYLKDRGMVSIRGKSYSANIVRKCLVQMATKGD